MAIQIKFDHGHNPLPPTIVLANRGGHKYGVLPAVNINLTDSLEEASELQFRVYKYDNGEKCALWDSLVDLKLVWCVEWDVWFEIAVETNDSVEGVYKSVSGKSLGEAELDEIMLYEIEINTEDDIAREDYRVTVLYDAEHPDGSLLDRIREKAPHYSIGHVDASIAGIQRTYTFDNKSILEALREIGEEVGCLFMIDSGSDSNGRPARIINAYDLKSACNDCGYRGDFTGACPECGSTNVARGYGDQTNIFVSSDNLASEINFSTNVDAVKSCYRLIGGDDLMTATIANCNPNGTNYIWYITEEMMDDMSIALRERLAQYYVDYANYTDTRQTTLNATIVSQYNALINKYRSYDDSLETVTNPVTGYAPLMKIMYDAIDFELLLSSELMPSPATASTNAATEAAKLTSSALTPVAVSELANCSSATATSAVLSVAKMIVNKGFQVKANNGVLDGEIWEGSFTVTNYSDSEDTATTGVIEVTVSDGYEDYVSQRLSNLMSDASDDVTDIISLFELNLASFKNELKKYCLERLNSFRDACQACVDLLIQQGISNNKTWAREDPNLYATMYVPYYNKLNAIIAEVKLRENEIGIISGVYDANGGLKKDGMQPMVERATQAIQDALNLENYLGTSLMDEFAAYRREDEYSDDNYISDGLSNAELFERAQEFIESVNSEIYKALTQRCKLSAELSNLLAMKEFAPIVDDFEVGNWISVGVDGEVRRLRLMSYTVDFDSLSDIDVEYSDEVYDAFKKTSVLSTIRNANLVARTYQAMTRQVKEAKSARAWIDEVLKNGLLLGP